MSKNKSNFTYNKITSSFHPLYLANSTVSDSFPNNKSTYGSIYIIGSIKNCDKNWAEKLKMYGLFRSNACFATRNIACGHTVRKKP